MATYTSLAEGGSKDFEKVGALYVGFRFRWSKKAKMKLETVSFWRKISISIFKFSPFLYTMKAC